MITYNRSAFGLNLIFQLHGSAVYRAIVPSLISVGIYFLWRNFYNATNDVIVMKEDLGHPYAVGALVASASFLVVFRANQGYARYWEACGAVHHMMSKWMDATTHAGVYHLQCDHYKDVRPPSFFEYPELNNLYLTRDRERGVTYDEEEEAELLAEVNNKDNNNKDNNKDDYTNANDHDDEDGSKISRNESSLHQFKHKHGNKNISSNSTRTPKQQQQALREQLKRKTGAAHRKTVLHQEKEKRRAQAVVKSINYVPPPPPAKKRNPKSPTAHSTTTTTSVSSISRRIKAVTSHLSSDSSLPPLEQDHIIIIEQPDFPLRGINRRTQSADDIDRLETTIEESSQQNNNKNKNKTTKSKSKSKNNNHLSREFFELLQKEVAEASPAFSQPGKGKPYPLWGRPRLDGNWGAWYTQDEKTPLATFAATTAAAAARPSPTPNGENQDEDDDDQEQEDIDVANGNGKLPPEGFASIQGGRTPSLYLQELVHLSSLLVAVALATLRNDIDGSESPLAFYDPGSDWPAVDPDKDDWMKVSSGMSHLQKSFLYFLGMGRSPEEQTRYNAGRPLPVVGGVSDGEIRFLQMAKGPYAKTMLCWNWLSEFMIREHIAGSMGKVAPPIVSRCFQFLGDGMIHYNHARKVMFIPYPFVHAQLSVLFILVMIPVIPFLMDQYTDEAWLGAALSFFTILCLAGVNEVAREMENPFRNVPNEVPLVTFMAQYNEALITVYSGYHPDSFWNGQAILKQRQQHQQQQQQQQQQEEAERRNKNDEKTTTTEARTTTGISTNGGSPSTTSTTTPTTTTTTTRRQQEREDSRITISTDQSADDLSLSGWAAADQQQQNKDEVALLKEQVAKQAALIEQLFAQMGGSSSSPSPSKQQQKGATEEVVEEESTIVC